MGFFKRLLDTMGSLEATYKVLAAEYGRLDQSMPEQERLYRLLARRGGWRKLSEPFLRELALRLAKSAKSEDGGLHRVAKIARFVWISERGRLESTHYPAAARLLSQTPFAAATTEQVSPQYHPVSHVASALTDLASNMVQSGEVQNAQHALLAALDVDPDWVPALCMLGTLYHAISEHRKALPLLERALSTQEELKRQLEQYASIVAQIGDEDLLTNFEREIHRPHDTEDMLTATRQILAECRQALERDAPGQQ